MEFFNRCIECGKPINTDTEKYYFSECKGSRVCGVSTPKHRVVIHEKCYLKYFSGKEGIK